MAPQADHLLGKNILLILFADIGKARNLFAFDDDVFQEHFQRTNPHFAGFIFIKGFVDHHLFQSFAVTSDTVNFGTDMYDIDATARGILDSQADWLQRYPAARITIEGHCDERGTREYNLALGDRRANSAKNYLVARGIAASRITTISYGKERPLALGSDEASWAQNRRAVTVVLSGGGMSG